MSVENNLSDLRAAQGSNVSVNSNMIFISSTGNDATGEINKPGKPFATAQAGWAIGGSPTQFTLHIGAGSSPGDLDLGYGGTYDISLIGEGTAVSIMGNIICYGGTLHVSGNGMVAAPSVSVAGYGLAATGANGSAGNNPGSPGANGSSAGESGYDGSDESGQPGSYSIGNNGGIIYAFNFAASNLYANGAPGETAGSGGSGGVGGAGGDGYDDSSGGNMSSNGGNGGNAHGGAGGNSIGGDGGFIFARLCGSPTCNVTGGASGDSGSGGSAGTGGNYGYGYSGGTNGSSGSAGVGIGGSSIAGTTGTVDVA